MFHDGRTSSLLGRQVLSTGAADAAAQVSGWKFDLSKIALNLLKYHEKDWKSAWVCKKSVNPSRYPAPLYEVAYTIRGLLGVTVYHRSFNCGGVSPCHVARSYQMVTPLAWLNKKPPIRNLQSASCSCSQRTPLFLKSKVGPCSSWQICTWS